MTIQEIKALPRTEEGIFDLKRCRQMQDEGTSIRLRIWYIQHMRHMRPPRIKGRISGYHGADACAEKHAESEFTAENGADYTAALLHTVEQISPEIYENYRELLDNFRGAVKRMLEQYYDVKTKTFAMDETSEKYSAVPYRRHAGNIYF